ncbi:gluconate 2-dehydrogenase subunit 3 family protein [Oceanobacillus caeni]|uniref:Dehydrogenase n=1 Tax=Oceanobacillus caeni TaxID=405946 RepID=A0ABR5MMT3_9BACI|nr:MULTISPECIES: gluconate 2-dehydrogenase subunit 3 family protein [Bacillaceae]KKE78499.1 dehydrogenase [Bacilli bacterium VT-13-104]PZD85424.1 gluconate 2-dehydrogenase subunit 3 family protein [Bacilli bacterium]KPH78236.1 dehydrogenase [Oceanobacillus caeni]MBU8791325.1 gluconate 2-dehydrogenase subunit 3 family protein [Oceanobacillus caeni]MCR1834837.1 gluconate 2-dehydrogenase subunit 3 family protein [Oceanobacillus caeni]
MTKDNENKTSEEERISRRRFIKSSGVAVGGLAVGGVIGGLIPWRTEDNKQQRQAANETKNYNQALMFFSQAEFKTVEAATERIFPKDHNGPGAKDLGVPFYIDHQLAGSYGFNSRDYMEPPFFHGEKEQGYQGRLKRREIFRVGLRELQNYSHQKYKKEFSELSTEEQDDILKDFESDKVKLSTISASGFFNMLRGVTLEGLYSDPLYGGNIDMDGWRMRDYPGDQMNYLDVIEEGFKKIEPRSLRDHM